MNPDLVTGADPSPTTERFVYNVASDTRKGLTYRVDLLANGGAGCCSCRDFAIRRQPAIDAGEEILTRATQCKHCRKVLGLFVRQLMRELAKQEDIPHP